MATNETLATYAKHRTRTVTDPASPVSGNPVVTGQIPGVAIRDKYPTGHPLAGQTVVAEAGEFALSVKGIDGSGNSAVAAGDILYYVSGDTPKLSKKATGVRYGYAAEAITSGSTATIRVEIGY